MSRCFVVLVGSLGLLVGCGDPAATTPDAHKPAVDAREDATPDARPDAMPDARPDAPPDAPPDAAIDAPPDAAIDAAPDAAIDAAPDAPIDAGIDAPIDAAPDAPIDAPTDAGVDAPIDAPSCVNPATDCPATGTACTQPVCISGACGVGNTPNGVPTSGQTAGDCQTSVCDGNGGITQQPDDNDVPAADGNQCTSEVCTLGVGTHPPVPAGTACNQNGGSVCDAFGACVAAPSVTSVSPNDAAVAIASTSIAITFSEAMDPTTLTAQTALGACSGSIQVSVNDFTTCVGFAAAAPAMSGTNTIATLVPAPGLLVNRVYKVRVTTAATGATGAPLAATYTSSVGFVTMNPFTMNGGVVISQVYGGGGNSGAVYKNDFIELHNRGTTAVDLTGWSVQYASSSATGTWGVTNLSGTIQPGAYYLVQEAAGTGGTTSLPTPDATGSLALSGTAGKVALVNTTTALSGACPTGAQVVDTVGFGTSTNCSETAPTATLSNTTAAIRALSACVDTNANKSDFVVAAPVPRNSMSTAFICAPAQNESDAALEADYCDTQFPLSLSFQTGTTSPTVYGQIYEATVTEPSGAAANVSAQLGYGPISANPEYEAGWTWLSASYNTQVGNNDEYQATFTGPAAGSYRYAYRVSLDGGVSWTYCDNNQGDAGAGSNPGVTFNLDDLGVMTIVP